MIDRNALATDLESLGLKAISGAVRNNTLSLDRAMRSVERTRDKRLIHGDAKTAGECQTVLNRWWGDSDQPQGRQP